MASNYRTARHATEFTYSFTLPPGKYDVLLGFAEFLPRFCSEPAKRVFHVYVNDLQQLESFDIFAEAGGACFKGVEKTLTFVSVDAVDTKPLTIRFEAVVNRALVNYIHIKPAPKSSGECIPASDTGSSGEFDHLAHSVPGTYPRQTGSNPVLSYVDTDGDGFHTVLIDGSGSHTHFSDSTKNIVGKITAYKWTNVDTDKVVSMRKSFRMKFPLGTTRLKLEVIDNACSVDMAETTVTVTGAIQPGMYCYYYDALSDDLVGGSAGSITSPRPQFSAIAAKASFGFPTFPFVNTLFATRCLFFLQSTRTARTSMVEIDTFGTGDARVYRGDDLILDSTGATSAETNLALGLTAFEIIYHRRTTDQAPKMKFLLEGRTPKGTRLQHDRRTVLPILSALSPGDGPNVGGTRVKISGYGLYRPLKVRFAGKRVKLLTGGSSTEATVITPPGTGTVKVTATGFSAVPSNALNFAYGSTCDSIRFTQTAMKKQNGDDVNLLLLATCAAVGHDGKIYVGTRGATVQVIDYDVTSLKVTSHCYSKSVVDKKYKLNGTPAVRDFLGITFDPRDSVLRPYLTSSTLFWHRREMIDFSNKEAWRNGAVDRLKPGTDPSDSKVCLVYDKRIVSGLPVSNTDHSVNSLLFTQDGNLLIAVGGFTNAGLPATSLGGYWETHFSAALLEAKLSKAGFDGSIIYNNVDPRLARKVSGDVDIYARGFRNPYAMTMAASGDVYLADMGPNCKKGDTAASCSDYDDVRNAAWDPNADGNVVWQGKVRHGGDPNNCPFGIEREDKIVHVIEGKFYGHPNIQRGGGECAWIDPRDGKTAEDKPAPSNYKGPIQMMQSPVTGLQDYRANHFCGKMRGNLVMSRFLGRKTHRMGVSEGRKTSSPDEISAGGGIVVVENAHGDLIMPKHNEGKVVVLRPRVTTSAVFFVAGAIPYRHGRSGGTKIVIGGGNFGSSPSVTIGGATCDIVSISNIEITCIVPAGSAGPKTLSVSSAGQTIDLPKAVLYMSV